MRVLVLALLLLFTTGANAEKIEVAEHNAKVSGSYGIQIVEFFDYRCGYCKKMIPVLEKISEKHPKTQVILVEYPIFGGPSIKMSKSAMAVHTLWPDKYFDYHKALMQHRGAFNQNSVKEIATKLELNGEDILKEMAKTKYDKYLEENAKLAITRHVRGTPHLVVNGTDVRGAVSFEDLDEYIEELKK